MTNSCQIASEARLESRADNWKFYSPVLLDLQTQSPLRLLPTKSNLTSYEDLGSYSTKTPKTPRLHNQTSAPPRNMPSERLLSITSCILLVLMTCKTVPYHLRVRRLHEENSGLQQKIANLNEPSHNEKKLSRIHGRRVSIAPGKKNLPDKNQARSPVAATLSRSLTRRIYR